MNFQLALTTHLPGFSFEDLRALKLNSYLLSDKKLTLAAQLNELKQTTPHIDVLGICIADICNEHDIETLSALYPQCKLIANYGVGYSHIDLKAAARFGIRISNTPGVLAEATADIALALLLMTTRRLFEGAALIKNTGRYAGWKPDYMLGLGLQNKVIGIVGYGEIGRAFARRIESLGARYVILKAPWSTKPVDGQLNEEDFLATADIISFHCKLTSQSRGWLNAERIKCCKKGVVIINTARGEIIDETALANALHDEQVGAAGLDVFCNEPNLSDVLQQAPRLVVLPHLGSATFETRKAMSEIVLKNILAFAKGEITLPNEVYASV